MIESGLAKTVGTPPPAPADKLLLVTQDHDSGRSEAVLLDYRRINNDFLVIVRPRTDGSTPSWFRNLEEHPVARIEICDASFDARVHRPSGSQTAELLPLIDELQAHHDGADTKQSALLLTPIC